MPPVTFVAGGIISWAFGFPNLALSLAAHGALGLFTKRPRLPDLRHKGIHVTTKNANVIVPVVYGTFRVGGNLVYAGNYGEGNAFLFMDIGFVEGEINGIHQVNGVDQIYFDDEIYTNYEPNLTYTFYNGTAIQDPDPILSSIFSSDPAFADAFRGRCHILFKFDFNPDKYQHIPNITVIFEGNKLFDPRDNSWKFTNNPALVIRNFIINKRYGKGEDVSTIDTTTFNAVATVMEEYTWSDLAMNNNSTTLTSATGGFSNLSVGDQIEIYSGTNFQEGKYKVNKITDDNIITLNRTAVPSNYETLGDEIISNNDFNDWTSNTPDSWTKSNVIVERSDVSGYMNIKSTSGILVQNISSSITNGYTYRITGTVRSYKNQIVRIGIFNHVGVPAYYKPISVSSYSNYNEIVDQKFSFTWTASNANLARFGIDVTTYGGGSSAGPAFVKEVSMKRILSTAGSSGVGAKMKWTIDGAFYKDESAKSIMTDMLVACRCALIKSEGTYKLLYMDTTQEGIDMALTENDIIEDSLNVNAEGAFGKANKFKFQFFNEDYNYKLDEFTLTSPDYDPEKDEENEQPIELLGITNRKQAIKMASYLVDRASLDKNISFVAREKALQLEPYDIPTLTHSLPGWNGKELRVMDAKYLDNYTVALSCIEESDSLYDDVVNVSTVGEYDTTFPDIKTAPSSICNVNITEETYNYRERTFTRLFVSFDPPKDEGNISYPWYEFTEVYLSIDGENFKHVFNVTNDFYYENVQEGFTYYFKFRNVSIHGVKQDLSSLEIYKKKVLGLQSQPSDLGSNDLKVVCSDDKITVIATKISDSDITGYEFRISSDSETEWQGSLFLGFNKEGICNISGLHPSNSAFINGSTVKHRIWCSPRNNLGNYSENPRYVDIEIPMIKGSMEAYYFYITQGTGTHDNTEFADIGGGNYVLRVDHSGGLSGTYVSPEYDLGAGTQNEEYDIWGDFITNFTSAGVTAEDLFSTNTWNDSEYLTKNWDQIINKNNSAFPSIVATLAWDSSSHSGDTDITNYAYSSKNFDTKKINVINGRYLRVKIEITDPNYASYLRIDGDSVYDAGNVLRICVAKRKVCRTTEWGVSENEPIYSPV